MKKITCKIYHPRLTEVQDELRKGMATNGEHTGSGEQELVTASAGNAKNLLSDCNSDPVPLRFPEKGLTNFRNLSRNIPLARNRRRSSF